MIAPVCEQNSSGRYVYLPEEMKMLKLKSMSEIHWEILEKGDHYIPVELDEVLLFICPDRLIPIAEESRNTSEMDEKHLKVLGFVKTEAKYELYQDDGYTKDYNLDEHMAKIKINRDGKVIVEGKQDIECTIYDLN